MPPPDASGGFDELGGLDLETVDDGGFEGGSPPQRISAIIRTKQRQDFY